MSITTNWWPLKGKVTKTKHELIKIGALLKIKVALYRSFTCYIFFRVIYPESVIANYLFCFFLNKWAILPFILFTFQRKGVPTYCIAWQVFIRTNSLMVCETLLEPVCLLPQKALAPQSAHNKGLSVDLALDIELAWLSWMELSSAYLPLYTTAPSVWENIYFRSL